MSMLSARHLQQFHRSKLLCGMYGFMAKLSVSRLNIYQILMRYLLNFRTSIYSTSSSDQEGSGVVISTLETVPRARQQQSLGKIEIFLALLMVSRKIKGGNQKRAVVAAAEIFQILVRINEFQKYIIECCRI